VPQRARARPTSRLRTRPKAEAPTSSDLISGVIGGEVDTSVTPTRTVAHVLPRPLVLSSSSSSSSSSFFFFFSFSSFSFVVLVSRELGESGLLSLPQVHLRESRQPSPVPLVVPRDWSLETTRPAPSDRRLLASFLFRSSRVQSGLGSRGVVPPVLGRRCFCHARLRPTRRSSPHSHSRRGGKTAVACRTTRPLRLSLPPLCHCVPPRVLPGEGCLVLSLMTPTDDCDDRGRDNQHRSPLTVPYHYDSRLARSSSPTRLLRGLHSPPSRSSGSRFRATGIPGFLEIGWASTCCREMSAERSEL